MKNVCPKVVVAIVVILFTLTLFFTNIVFAGQDIDFTAKTSLSLTYGNGDRLLAGVNVRIYKVANISQDKKFVLTGDFKDDSVIINGFTTQSQWAIAAHTLSGYSLTDGRSFLSARTDSSGNVKFSDLDVGLYLVTSDRITVGSNVYLFDPFLISLPNKDNLPSTSSWIYDVVAYPKCKVKPLGGEPVKYKVMKHWISDITSVAIPKQIIIDLYCDGVLHSTEILDKNTGWAFSWISEDPNAYWQVVERNVEVGFTVMVDPNDENLFVTNTFGNIAPQPPTDPTDPTASTGSSIPSVPTTDPNLPDTGQLWWPVSILSAGGLFLIVIGLALIRCGKKDE